MGCGNVALHAPPNTPEPRLGSRWSGSAFGLALAGTLPLQGVPAPATSAGADATWLQRIERASLDRRWRRARPRPLLERRLLDGRVGLSVEHDDELGFRVWAPRHGCYLVSPDGRGVLAAPPAGPPWRWERLVLAQVLPLAAVLRGMELLHASTVAIDGHAVAFLGPSGVGKTTLAAWAVARGARLMTDDVLAIDIAAGRVRAHRAGAIARLDPRELRAMSPAERAPLGDVRVRADKWHVTPVLGPAVLPLGITYHLVRSPDVEGVSIASVRPYDPALLLGNAFLPYLSAPARLERQLEIGAAVARGTPLFRVRVGSRGTPAAVADAVLPHARSVLGRQTS